MEPFTTVTSRILPLPRVDVDTDQITPARFLRTSLPPGGYGEILFHDLRYDADGRPRPEFVLNDPERRGAAVLVAGENFGCGSSRETAVWALVEHGILAVVAPSFGDIFHTNALKNGLLPVRVDEEVLARLLELARDPAAEATVDLEACELGLPDGSRVAFPVDPFARHCLLRGLDQLGYLLSQRDAIAAHEARHPLPSIAAPPPA